MRGHRHRHPPPLSERLSGAGDEGEITNLPECNNIIKGGPSERLIPIAYLDLKYSVRSDYRERERQRIGIEMIP